MAEHERDRFERAIRQSYGAVLVTGPTGSGKSTTLYAALGEINTPEKNIITIEDPVEYQVAGITQVQVNPKAGLDFATGLRSMMRADPDVIMVGEIRDRETAQIAVEAALTGHLVLSTLHTNDAPTPPSPASSRWASSRSSSPAPSTASSPSASRARSASTASSARSSRRRRAAPERLPRDGRPRGLRAGGLRPLRRLAATRAGSASTR